MGSFITTEVVNPSPFAVSRAQGARALCQRGHSNLENRKQKTKNGISFSFSVVRFLNQERKAREPSAEEDIVSA